MRRPAERLGEWTLGGFSWVGGAAMMFALSIRAGLRRPWNVDEILRQIVHVGVRSIPMAMFMSMFIGLIFAVQFGEALVDFGATAALGKVASLGLVQEMVPAVLAVTVGARISAGMTAELGSMKVTEQIDAVAALGGDPRKKLIWPRLVAATVALLLLVVLGNVIAMLGASVMAYSMFGIPPDYFFQTYIEQLAPADYAMSLTKGAACGCVVAVVGCHNGFETKLGTEAVGVATANTIIQSALSVIIVDFAITVLFLRE